MFHRPAITAAVVWFATFVWMSLVIAASLLGAVRDATAQTVVAPARTVAVARQPAPTPAPPNVVHAPTTVPGRQGAFVAGPQALLSCIPPAAPAEIVELARALKWNPDLIYEYVRNNIVTVPIYDSLKGPLGTLIDGAGTPVDQSELMYVLLQQSCFSPQYEVGMINLTAAQLDEWLGTQANVPNNPNQLFSVYAILSENGFCTTVSPTTCGGLLVYTSDGTLTGQVTSADVPWVWIAVPIAGTTYQFDPASKIFSGNDGYLPRSRGLGASLPTALGYTQSNFISAAETGASGIGTPAFTFSPTGRANARSDLAGYASNLVSYIKSTNPTATTTDIVGGGTIQLLPPFTPPAVGPTRWGQTSLPYLNLQKISPTTASNLNLFRTTLALTLGWNDSNNNFTSLVSGPVTFNSSDIYGHRLSVQFDPSTDVPSLLLDGVIQATATGAVPSPNRLTIRAAITHPHVECVNIPTPTGCSNNTNPQFFGTDNMRVVPSPSAIYVIGNGWGGTNRAMIEKHRKLLRQNQAQGGSATSEPVLGESLAMIGYTYLAENARMQILAGELSGTTTTYLHQVGIIGMSVSGSVQGPYVDWQYFSIFAVQNASRPQSVTNNVTPQESATIFTISALASVIESGTIKQTQPKDSSGNNVVASSTVTVLDQASGAGGTIFDANDPNISGDGCAYYVSNIRGNITPSSVVAQIDSLMGYSTTSGCASPPSTTQVVVPANGSISIGLWTGTGYFEVIYSANQQTPLSMGSIISGGLSGGFSGSDIPPEIANENQASGAVDQATGVQISPPSQQAASDDSSVSTNIAGSNGGTSAAQPNGGDPVVLVTGSYLYNHQDLSVGSGPFPFTLPFTRSYDSGLGQARTNTSLLGNGWMHNYDVVALVDSDGFEGMGENSPINGAAAIAAIFVIQDILNLQTSTAKPADRLIIAAIASQWFMDQLTNNIVSVAQAGSIERFSLLTNGSYNPPLGSATVFAANTGGYTYQTGTGVTLSFNPPTAIAVGKIVSWANAAGATVNFTYDASGRLQSVVNPATHRQLNLHYTSTQLTSVDDDTGSSPRTVSYGYDSQNDLILFTDPLQLQTRFAYGSPGQLTQIFYPSHPSNDFVSMTYDSLGRPAQQADANGNVTTLYFAGTRTEIDDPGGTARVSYFTARGKTLASIAGLGSPTINNGAGNQTNYTYDGLDRVLTSTFPEGNFFAFLYDANSNPLTITNNPKPGSPLSSLETLFAYVSPVTSLPNFEEVQTATDPRDLVTAYSYDTKGNRTQVIADSGGAGHFNATNTFTYDSNGRLLTSTDQVGVVTQYSYDSSENLISVIAGYGSDCQSSQHFHICAKTQIGYDAVGNVASVTNSNGVVTNSSFDADRRVTTVTIPAAASGNGLVTATTYDPDGRVLQTQQSSAGQVLRTTSGTYTLAGKLATTKDANGNTTNYAYDVVDRVSQVVDAVGRTTSFTYDPLSRLFQKLNLAIQTPPLEQYAYTPNGKLASFADGHVPNGNTTTFNYDGFDRLGTTIYPDNTMVSLTYDADSNRLTRKTRAGATISFAYDTLNRLITQTPPSPEPTVSYSYDLTGRLTGVSDNSAAIVSAVPPTGMQRVAYGTSYTYDALNHRTGVIFGTVSAAATPSASQVTFQDHYDATNRRTSQTTTDDSYWMRPAGVAATTSYTANNLNQYTAVGPITPTYDGNGNLTFDGTFTYGYDAENRLTSVTQSSTSVASYAYDGQGRRKLKSLSGGATTISVYDGDQEALTYDGTSGQIQQRFVWGIGTDDAVSQINVAAASRSGFISDIQGSVIATIDAGSGALTKTAYLSFGESNTTTGTYRYTGRRIDAESNGLYYYRTRMYAPGLGRFLQPDSIGYAGGANLYAYVGNDPLNNIDPSGEFLNFIIGGAIGFGVDLAVQLAQSYAQNQPFHYDVTRGLIATGIGAVTAGASAFVSTGAEVGGSALAQAIGGSFTQRVVSNTVIGAVGNIAQTAALNNIENQNGSYVTSALLGAGGGAAGSVTGELISGIRSTPGVIPGSGVSVGQANELNNILETSGATVTTLSPASVTLGSAVGGAIGAVSSAPSK